MKKKIMILILFFSASFFIFSEIVLLNNTEMNLVNIKKYSESNYSMLNIAILKEPVKIKIDNNLIALKADREIVYNLKEKYITFAYIDGNTDINIKDEIITLLDGSPISFIKDYKIGKYYICGVNLKADTKIKIGDFEVPCKAQKNLEIDYNILFNNEGNITKVVLAENKVFEIGGQSIPLLKDTTVKFFPKGKIKSGYISKDIDLVINSNLTKIRKAQRILFNDSGKIIKIE